MRARDIKPGFFRNDELAECSFAARLLYPGLWMLADREGRLEYRPKRIKAEILPYDNVDVVELLYELEKQGLIVRYSFEGSDYLWIPTFKKHQSPHVKEKPSEIPACPEEAPDKPGANTVQAPDKPGANPSSSLTPSSLTPSSLPPEDKESPIGDLSAEADPAPASEPEELSKAGLPPCPHQQIIDLYHQQLPELPRVRVWNDKRKKNLAARWKEIMTRLAKAGKPQDVEHGLDWLLKFFGLVRASPFLMGDNPKGWTASLDWLVLPNNFAKTLERQYADRRAA